jgi:hypothetical protein
MNIDIWLHIQNIFESITSFEMKQRHYALLLFTALVIAIIKGRKYQPSGVRSDSDTSFVADFQTYHPLTGNPMCGGTDTMGHPIGYSPSSDYEHRSAHDPHHH